MRNGRELCRRFGMVVLGVLSLGVTTQADEKLSIVSPDASESSTRLLDELEPELRPYCGILTDSQLEEWLDIIYDRPERPERLVTDAVPGLSQLMPATGTYPSGYSGRLGGGSFGSLGLGKGFGGGSGSGGGSSGNTGAFPAFSPAFTSPIPGFDPNGEIQAGALPPAAGPPLTVEPVTPTPQPEPTSLALLASGVAGLIAARRRKAR